MISPLPVLLMCRELGAGGTERQLTEVAKALDRSRFSPHVACFHPEGPRAAELAAAAVPVARFGVRSLYSPSTLRFAVEFGRYVRRHGIRLVHAFDVPANLFATPSARAFSVPVVLTSQRANRELTPGVFRHALRLTDQIADGVVVNCLAMRRHLIEDERVPAGRIHLCYNAIDTGRFQPLEPFHQRSRPEPLQTARIVVGVVCVLRPEKALETLVRAFAGISPAGAGIRLAIIGSGPARNGLEQLAHRCGVAEDTVFIPATADVTRWLHAMDIFVLPSRSEALSNSLMEAMACGCAAVASRTGGNPELVQHERTGLLFEPGSPNELAQRLAALVANTELRRSLAAAGCRFVHENFSTRAMVGHMEEIYCHFLDRVRP